MARVSQAAHCFRIQKRAARLVTIASPALVTARPRDEPRPGMLLVWFKCRRLLRRSQMNRRVVLHITSVVVLVGSVACETQMPTEPDAKLGFTGRWVGVSRVVSCDPAGASCESFRPGFERYFDVTLTQQGDAVEGSVGITPPGGPLALPYGFPIKGLVVRADEMTFERLPIIPSEPRFSGSLTLRTSSLIGRMTEERSPSPGQPTSLVWDVASVRRQP